MSGRRTSGSSGPSLGVQVLAVFSSGCRKRRSAKGVRSLFRFRDTFGHFLVIFSDVFVTFFVTFLPDSFCRTPKVLRQGDFLHFPEKIAVRKTSGRTPGSPRHPSSRHPRPSEPLSFYPRMLQAALSGFGGPWTYDGVYLLVALILGKFYASHTNSCNSALRSSLPERPNHTEKILLVVNRLAIPRSWYRAKIPEARKYEKHTNIRKNYEIHDPWSGPEIRKKYRKKFETVIFWPFSYFSLYQQNKGAGRTRGRRILPQNPSPKKGQNGAHRPVSETKFLDDFWGPLSLPAPLFYC